MELDLHAEFHFPAKPQLRCARCKKPCPYFIKLPQKESTSPQFLMCQECLSSEKERTKVLLSTECRSVRSKTPDARLSMAPSLNYSVTPPPRSPDSLKLSANTPLSDSPGHKCPLCHVKFETGAALEGHTCLASRCGKCQKPYRASESGKRNASLCMVCDLAAVDMWKCDKCKLTFTREEKYQKHNCMALGRFSWSDLVLMSAYVMIVSFSSNI